MGGKKRDRDQTRSGPQALGKGRFGACVVLRRAHFISAPWAGHERMAAQFGDGQSKRDAMSVRREARAP